ncbi:MAG: transcriptional regulator FtrA [Elstera sp.]
MPKNETPTLRNSTVVALAYDGLCLFEFGIVAEVFGLSRPEITRRDWYKFRIAAVDPLPLRAQGGMLSLATDGGLELLAEAGTILIPGWRGVSGDVPEALCAALRDAADRGARILSICSGLVVLAEAGLLAGRRATTHWRYIDQVATRFPWLTLDPNVLYVDEGQILTSAGSAAGLDLCLHLVRRDFGAEIANLVARRLVVAPHREGGQAQFIDRPVPQRAGTLFAALFGQVQAEIADDWPVDRLAATAGMSRRTFLRRFQDATGTTPADWLLSLRLQGVKDLLETSTLSVEEIATRCGFGAAGTLRHHFRQRLGMTPQTYRQRFRTIPEAVAAQ